MPKLLTKFYKLSESWLKNGRDRLWDLWLFNCFLNHGRDGDDDDDDDDAVLSDIFLLIIAFISLYLALEVFKTICNINC